MKLKHVNCPKCNHEMKKEKIDENCGHKKYKFSCKCGFFAYYYEEKKLEGAR